MSRRFRLNCLCPNAFFRSLISCIDFGLNVLAYRDGDFSCVAFDSARCDVLFVCGPPLYTHHNRCGFPFHLSEG